MGNVTSVAHKLDADPDNRSIATFTGLEFDILAPNIRSVSADDVFQALGNACRYAGQIEFLSVAEHSIQVMSKLREWGAPRPAWLLGLLHDMTEAYLLDIPRPWKGLVRIGEWSYYEVEHRLMKVMLQALAPSLLDLYPSNLGGSTPEWEQVKRADLAVYQQESDRRPEGGVWNPTESTVRMHRHYTSLTMDLEET